MMSKENHVQNQFCLYNFTSKGEGARPHLQAKQGFKPELYLCH